MGRYFYGCGSARVQVEALSYVGTTFESVAGNALRFGTPTVLVVEGRALRLPALLASLEGDYLALYGRTVEAYQFTAHKPSDWHEAGQHPELLKPTNWDNAPLLKSDQ